MPLELIFTSVPKGVKPGSSGYCTVAKHKGIDRLLDQAVEKICYYELMNHPAKPVVCAYRIMNLNTGIFHVLTRTVYSGSDHTGRTNYISHNLIFDQKEALSQNVSPADIFLNGSGWLDNWPSGQSPAYLKDGICQISFPSGSATSKPLALWEKITGQGILAHELLNHDKWKFLTESGDHLLMLSLLSEFAQADNNSLRASWGQLTFVTYLQPTENPDDFNIIGGDSSVQKFGTLVCSTLNLSSSAGPQFCFSENWSGGAFGPLPKTSTPGEGSTGSYSTPPPFDHGGSGISNSDNATIPVPPPPRSQIPVPPSPNSVPPFPSVSGARKVPPKKRRATRPQYKPRSNPRKKSKVWVLLVVLLALGGGGAFFAYNKLIPPPIPSTSEEKLLLKKDFDANQISVNSNDTSSKEERSVNSELPEVKKTDPSIEKEKYKAELTALIESISDDENQPIHILESHLKSLKNKIDKVRKKISSSKEFEKAEELFDKLKEVISVKKAESSIPKDFDISPFVAPFVDEEESFAVILTDEKPVESGKTYIWDGNSVREKNHKDSSYPQVFWVDDESIYLTKQHNISFQLREDYFKHVEAEEKSKYTYSTVPEIQLPATPSLWRGIYPKEEIINVNLAYSIISGFVYDRNATQPLNDWGKINHDMDMSIEKIQEAIRWLKSIDLNLEVSNNSKMSKDPFKDNLNGNGIDNFQENVSPENQEPILMTIRRYLTDTITKYKWGDKNETLPTGILACYHHKSLDGKPLSLIEQTFYYKRSNPSGNYVMFTGKEFLIKKRQRSISRKINIF
jgi:hypothetical protein